MNRRTGRELSDDKLYTINFFCWRMEISFKIGLHFRKYFRSMVRSLIVTALTFNQLVKSSILKLDNKTENYYNYTMEQSFPIQTVFTKFLFSFKVIKIRDSQQKEKKMKERNNDKKKNQIRICLYQL